MKKAVEHPFNFWQERQENTFSLYCLTKYYPIPFHIIYEQKIPADAPKHLLFLPIDHIHYLNIILFLLLLFPKTLFSFPSFPS